MSPNLWPFLKVKLKFKTLYNLKKKVMCSGTRKQRLWHWLHCRDKGLTRGGQWTGSHRARMSRAHTQSQLLSLVTKNLKLITAMPAEERDCSPHTAWKVSFLPPANVVMLRGHCPS